VSTILIVDDLAANRQVLTSILLGQGHRCLEAPDGARGLAMVQADYPDLIITDVLMPVMDGYEFVRQLRLDPAAAGIPVIFYTASYGAREARALATATGVPHVLTKPADAGDVLRVVDRVLSAESDKAMPGDVVAPTTEVDSEHLRLLTGQASQDAGDLRNANARLRALINIGLELASEREPDRLLSKVCVATRDLFAASYVTLGILNLNDRTVQKVISCGIDAPDWIRTGDPVSGLLGTVVGERRTMRGDNPGGDPVALQLPVAHPQVRSFLAAPIASPANIYGWICFVGNEGRAFTEDDEHLVMALSGQIGRIYENGYFRVVADARADALEREVAERTLAEQALLQEREALRIAEGKVRQTQKMDAIGQLAGGVAHDFNNLLTAILGYCELVLSDLEPGDPHQADVEEIQKAGTRAVGLTRQLLMFSRKQIIEPARLDLNGIVTDMRMMLCRLIEADVRMVLALTPAPVFIDADRGHVEQIVMNLAVNARDAMPRGGTLTIGTRDVVVEAGAEAARLGVSPGRYAMLSVCDTGTGITPEVLARLFEPFFTTKELGKGTGLGLATVHGIVESLGGCVDVASAPGKGASFRVYFPMAGPRVAISAAPLVVARVRTAAETVLVVDDDDGFLELVRRLLERQGYTVLLAQNADDAQRLFDAHPSIDVLLTDVVMPGASGLELTQRLCEQRPGLKVVYMSGYPAEAIASHGVLNPGIALLHKPFTAGMLTRKIREALDM
jgi:signal transduction histidine kinase/DNA-binding response OmpR family regulator